MPGRFITLYSLIYVCVVALYSILSRRVPEMMDAFTQAAQRPRILRRTRMHMMSKRCRCGSAQSAAHHLCSVTLWITQRNGWCYRDKFHRKFHNQIDLSSVLIAVSGREIRINLASDPWPINRTSLCKCHNEVFLFGPPSTSNIRAACKCGAISYQSINLS